MCCYILSNLAADVTEEKVNFPFNGEQFYWRSDYRMKPTPSILRFERKIMRNLLFATVALATLGVTSAGFAGGPGGGTGTYEPAQPSMSGSSDSADSGSGRSAPLVQPPSGGKGGYPARQSNGCPAIGSPQSTTAAGQNC
jgi:hypothetical protein